MQWTRAPAADLQRLGRSLAADYRGADPFPHAVIDDFLEPDRLEAVRREFPELAKTRGAKSYDDPDQIKRASRDEAQFGAQTRRLMHYLNSAPFLEFLSALTGIDDLIADPTFEGGGLHEILPGGFLKVHADFNKHRQTGLDRRLNLLVYLNRDWEDAWGGGLELWDREMTRCARTVLPTFNRAVVFTTTDVSYHGHPDPLRCPRGRSRRSLALYYYTEGRPAEEVGEGHSTLFRDRPGTDDATRPWQPQLRTRVKRIIRRFTR